MSSIPASMLEALIQAWKALTGGALSVVVGDQAPEGALDARRFPQAIRRALERQADLASLPTRGRKWWVTAPLPTSAIRVQIAAWAPRDGGWKPVLQLWSDLLAGYLEQKLTAEGMTEELINAWDRLTFLYELAQIASRPSETDEMLAAIVRLLSQVVSAEDVLLVTSAEGRLAAFTASNAELPMPEALVASVAGAPRPLSLDELKPALQQAGSPLADVGDLLVAPLVGGGGAGAIGLVNPPDRRFDANDVLLLASVAEQVNALLEASKSRAALLQSQRLQHELAIAADLQTSLLPVSLPAIEGFELAARLLPARRVGGDFYDAVVAEDGEVMLLLADVAGKGMPAAMLTAVVHATFMSETAHSQDPAGVLHAMNRLIYQDLDRTGTFVTAIAARLESKPCGFTYASAGHVDLAVWRAERGVVDLLPATGLPLGLEPGSAYVSRRLSLGPGDVLLFYSDGVTEAEGPDGAMFGVEGLADVLWAAHPARAEDQVRAIVEGLDAHRGDLPLRDDVALLLARVVASQEAAVTPFVIPAQLGAVSRVVELSRRVCDGPAFAEGTIGRRFADEFALAVSEIVTNQVQHAYGGRNGRIQGRLSRYPDRVQADLSDDGILFERSDLTEPQANPEDPPDRGYGLRIARALLDRCEYRRLPRGRNHWCLVKRTQGARTDED